MVGVDVTAVIIIYGTSAVLNLKTIIGDVNMLTQTSHTLLQTAAAQVCTDADMADDLP